MVDVEGGEPTNLTEYPASDVDPSWSPDGTKIGSSAIATATATCSR